MSNLDDAAQAAFVRWHASWTEDEWLEIQSTFEAGYREAIADLRLTEDDLVELRRQTVFDSHVPEPNWSLRDLADRLERVMPS